MEIAKGSFLLQVEGINLSQVFEDTQNINVIRGSSMALRDAVKKVEAWLKEWNVGASVIQTGASVGLFHLPVDEKTAKDCLEKIVGRLNRDELLKYFTFSADIQALTDLEKDRECLLAKIRFRQMQQAGLSVPDWNSSNTIQPCPLDGIRPATQRTKVKDEDTLVSTSIAARLNYGRDGKHQFFETETGHPLPKGMTRDLSEIALGLKRGNQLVYPQLNGKLAYFYVDGNSFGSVITNVLKQTGEDPLALRQKWDDYIQAQRKAFLSQFVGNACRQLGLCEDFATVDGRLRMEILLWGGDEFLLVVPAWLGFHTMSAFFQHSATWEFKGQPLTHAGGLVFCHHKTPVHRIRNLAKELADEAKKASRDQNLYDCIVLESIDFPTEPLGQFFMHQYSKLAENRKPLIPVDWDRFSKQPRDILLGLPKSQVYEIAKAAVFEGRPRFDQALYRLKELIGQGQLAACQNTLEAMFKMATIASSPNCPMWPWVRLAELWDYLDGTPRD